MVFGLKKKTSEDNTYYIIHSLGMDKRYGNIENVIFLIIKKMEIY